MKNILLLCVLVFGCCFAGCSENLTEEEKFIKKLKEAAEKDEHLMHKRKPPKLEVQSLFNQPSGRMID